MEGITFAMTCCNRNDLLEKSFDSFLEYNTAKIRQYIISEDCRNSDLTYLKEKYKQLNILWLQNEGPRRGMLGNIDFLYKHVNTDYIWHAEEDWLYYKKGFIEESMAILGPNPEILQVWVRDQTDTNGHPIEPKIYTEERLIKTKYKLVSLDYLGCFSGYSTNPGLRRLKDKVCFQALSELGPACIGPEGKVSIYYKLAGFRAAITLEGYVRHIGEGRTTL